MKPEIGKIYKLTYFGSKHERGRDVISLDFEYKCKRRSGYYFLSTNGVIDLVLKEYQFEEYSTNTIESLLNK